MKLYDFCSIILLDLEAIHVLKKQNLVFRLKLSCHLDLRIKKVNVKSFSFVEQTLLQLRCDWCNFIILKSYVCTNVCLDSV